MRITTGALTFDVDVAGPASGPAVLLLHGFPQNRHCWPGVAARLNAAGLRTIAPDQRGYSPDARPTDDGAYRITACADDAVALLDALDVPAAHVVGHDWGAFVAWFAADRHPARISTVTGVSVPHPAAFTDGQARRVEQRVRTSYIPVFKRPRLAPALLGAGNGWLLRRLFTGSGLDRAGVDRYVAPLLAPGALTAALAWYRMMSAPEMAALPPTTQPTTYLWGGRDGAVARSTALRCAAHVTGPYRYVELPGATHWIPECRPGVLADAVLDRIRSAG
jgi:pimeloyl-ACP methyl ester carboxylesterase